MCRHVAARYHYDVRLAALVVAGPVPDSDALGAVLNSLLHVEVLQMLLLVRDNDVDVVGAAEAMVHNGEEAVAVWGQVDADDFWALVGDYVEEAGVLVREAVVVLSPDCGCEEDVERGDFLAPFDFEAFLEPLAVLVDHGVNDVDEGFVAVEKPVPT